MLMPTLNEKFPPPHGVDSLAVTGLLQLCAVAILIALVLTLVGLARAGRGDRSATDGRG
jgi:hypothetical protein